jgi:exopolyphosphatase/guanosine-5'-triphosphate,3'-diphosphate pyrophosphatase
MDPAVAIIDIGSNSLKLLVANRGKSGGINTLLSQTIETRISQGISQAAPRLSAEGIASGLTAIQALLATAAPYSPVKIILVATSAVRDATNGADFRARVAAETGHEIRVLTGEEEANMIGLGLSSDPAFAALNDFYLFDLGGGSLECLRFVQRKITQTMSLQLGCVRLTERFIKDPAAPLVIAETTALALHVRDELKRSSFRFPLVAPPAIFMGGSMNTVRSLKGARHNLSFAESPTLIGIETIAALLDEISQLNLVARQALPGMSKARADVFPAALITMLTVADYAHIDRFHHSLHNLRWGLAAEALAGW